MIVGGIVEPFTQQIISFPQQSVPSQDGNVNASVAYSWNFTAGIPFDNGDPGMRQIVRRDDIQLTSLQTSEIGWMAKRLITP